MNMKKSYYILIAAVGVIFTGCTSDDIVVNEAMAPVVEAETPIVFGSVKKGMTRADATGAEAAELLGNQFVVSGYKGSSTASVGNIVFDNYLVKYVENTANTTQSNTTNWEYVGVDRIKHAIDNGITSQQIKYWDYSKDQYDFIAWSTGATTAIYEGTPAAGQVLVSAITPKTATGTGTGKVAYTFTGTAADLRKCYIADLVTVKKSQYGDDPVTFKFRQLGTKVRIAIYETVPGYSVKNVEFYSAAASNDASAAAAKLFTTTANDIYTEGTYTVTFPTVDADGNADNNQAHVTFAPKAGAAQSTIIDWGGLNYTIAEEGEKLGTEFLGRTSATASYAGNADNNYYVVYLPNEVGTNLNLRVNYTLESIDGSGEEITVKGATAQVPGIYTTWKPGFAYTYIFKISDKTNGYTGVYDPTKPDDTTVNSDPAGLYPITFDALVENAEDNDATQETITLVSTPSITTYQKGSNVVNNNEYLAATGPIFVTVNDGGGYVEVTGLSAGNDVSSYYTFNTTTEKYEKCGSSAVAVDGTKYYKLEPVLANGALQTLTGKAALYTIPAGKTEADVIDALQMRDDDAATGTIKGRSGLVLTEAAFTLTNSVEYGVDGNAIPVATDQAAKFTASAGTYAFVYIKKAPTTANDVVKYQALKWANFETGQTKYRYDYKAPTHSYYNDNGTTDDTTDDIEYFDAQKGVKYFAKDGEGKYTMQAPFVGQGVSNLYLDAAGNTIASGYAVTGTDYYYTIDKGMTYKKATNIAYADFAGATDLYTFDSGNSTYSPKADTTPVNGTAYYRKTTSGGVDTYTYCVILPQQTSSWYELDTTKYVKATETEEVDGQTYFDKYTKNDGVYYTKVINVQ